MNKFSKPKFKFETGNSKEYKIKAIQNNIVYAKEVYR